MERGFQDRPRRFIWFTRKNAASRNNFSFALHAKFRRQVTMKFSVQLLHVSVFLIDFLPMFWFVIYLVPFLLRFTLGQVNKKQNVLFGWYCGSERIFISSVLTFEKTYSATFCDSKLSAQVRRIGIGGVVRLLHFEIDKRSFLQLRNRRLSWHFFHPIAFRNNLLAGSYSHTPSDA